MRLVAKALAILLSVSGTAAHAQVTPLELRPGETLLEVEASGTHWARPDVMRVSAGIVTTGATARQASQANATAVARLIETVRASGIDARDIQTSRLRLQPRFDRNDERRAEDEERTPRIVGYVATNTLELHLRDLSRASAILDSLLDAGANDVAGPSFSFSDERPALRAARALAIAAAREQAETYAAALGMRVERVLMVSERGGRVEHAGIERIVVRGSAVRGTVIEPGEIEARVDVWVDFALVPR